MIRRLAAAFTLALLVLAPAALAQDFPEFINHVVDQAKVVPDDIEHEIDAELADYQRRADIQIAVAVVETVGDHPLEDYVIDLAREWDVGTGKTSGVLLFLAIEERASRIEVARQLEGDLTDIESGRLLRGQMRTLLQQGDYGQAILIATHQIREALGDDQVGNVPAPVADEPSGGRGRGIGSWIFFIPFLIFGPLGRLMGQRRGRRRGWITPIFWGGGFGGLGGGGSSGSSGGGFGGFGGGSGGGGFGGGGASGGW